MKQVSQICFTCLCWIGTRRKKTGYCVKWSLSGKDGNQSCTAWEKRHNARFRYAEPNIADDTNEQTK